jgi:hypothetical protein
MLLGSTSTDQATGALIQVDAARFIHFHNVSSDTPPTMIAATRTIFSVTRSTSRKKSAVNTSEKNGVLLWS